jgi:hypothetical protein
MEPLIEKHIDELREHNHGHTDEWLMKKHKNWFTSWLREHDIPDRETIEKRTIKVLASRPSCQVTTWQTYDISGFTYCTKSKDKKSMSRTMEFDVMPYTLKLVGKLHTFASLRTYGN